MSPREPVLEWGQDFPEWATITSVAVNSSVMLNHTRSLKAAPWQAPSTLLTVSLSSKDCRGESHIALNV